MNITSAKYTAIEGKNAGITAVIGDTTWYIPLVEDNAQYQKVLEWAKEDGNTIQEAD